MSIIGVRISNYLECGRHGPYLHYCRHFLDDAILSSGKVMSFTHRILIGAMRGLYVDVCHIGVKVFVELFCFSCDAVLEALCPDCAPSWPVVGQGVCFGV
jgi:hypothetical protein